MNKLCFVRASKIVTITSIIALLGGCSTVGPGFANHPGDCAIGIPWADCLPGTRGYANGGGSMHKEAAQKVNDEISNQYKSASDQCAADMQITELEPLRHKIEFMRLMDDPPPFEFASNDSFPSASDLPLIAKWATIRDGCMKRSHAINYIPKDASPLVVTFLQQEHAFPEEAEARVSDLVLALYQSKLTYGEFAQKRYEIGKAAVSAQRQYREAKIIEDQQRQLQAQQIANEQFNNSLTAWSTYMQSVNARQPQTVHLDGTVRVQTNCSSYRTGNTVNTNCY